MRRHSWILLLAAGCGNDSAPEQVRRGHDVFAPCARKLAAGLFAETKARDPGEAAKLVAAAGVADEAAFVELSAREVLVRFGVVLSLTETQAAEFRAGRFNEAGNRKRVDETLAAFGTGGLPLPEVCRYASERSRAGAWSGLDLEFAARLLWGEAMRPR